MPSSASVSRSSLKPKVSASVISGGAASDADSVSDGTPLANTAVGAPASSSFDLMMLLGSRAAPTFAVLLDTRARYLGHIQGMAYLCDLVALPTARGGRGAKKALEQLLYEQLTRVAFSGIDRSPLVPQALPLLEYGPAVVVSGVGKLEVQHSKCNIRQLLSDVDSDSSTSDDDSDVFYDDGASTTDSSSASDSEHDDVRTASLPPSIKKETDPKLVHAVSSAPRTSEASPAPKVLPLNICFVPVLCEGGDFVSLFKLEGGHAFKGLALLRASHSGEIAPAGSRRICVSRLRQHQSFFRTLFSQ